MTALAIAGSLGMARSTVGVIPRRPALGKLSALEPCEAVVRYELEHPGELIHLDIKSLGKIDGIGHRITATAQASAASAGSGGATCTSPSMTPRAWATPKSCPA